MALLSELDPVGSLLRKKHRLQRRHYYTKVVITDSSSVSSQYYYNRVLTTAGTAMEMINSRSMGFVYMDVLMGKHSIFF